MAPRVQNRKAWIIAFGALAAVVGFAVPMLLPHHGTTDHSDNIGAFVAVYAALMAAVSAAARRRRKAQEEHDA